MVDLKVTPETQIPEEYHTAVSDLKTDVTRLLGDLTCPVHGRHARLVFNCSGGKVRLAGFGPCCNAFGLTLKTTIEGSSLNVSGEEWQSMTKVVRYSSRLDRG